VLSFREYLGEEIEKTGEHYGHKSVIGGRTVSVAYIHQGGGHYGTHFWVDGTQDSPDKSDKSGAAAAHFVSGSVKRFIKQVKPSKLSFLGNSERKNKAYKIFAHHIAKAHAAKASPYQYVGSQVEFKK
jgi:hypothetical protein